MAVRGPREEHVREADGIMEEAVYVMGGEHCRTLFVDEDGSDGESDTTSCSDERDYGEDIQAQIDRLDANLSHIQSLVDPSEEEGGETEVLLDSEEHGSAPHQPLGSRIFGRRRQSPRVRGIVVEERSRGGGYGMGGGEEGDRMGLCGRSVRPHTIMFGLAAVLFGVAIALQVMVFYKWELRGLVKAFVADIPPRGVMEIQSVIQRDTDNLQKFEGKLHW